MGDPFGKKSLQSGAEPTWRSERHLRNSALPRQWRSWLLDPSSLTRRLQQSCRGRFHVEVLRQRMERPMRCEAQALGSPRHQLALVRQVRLHCNDRPWVFARTVIPLSTLTGGERRLANLGSRPLGAHLFADPNLHRDPVEVAHISAGQRPYRLALGTSAGDGEGIWGRRSVFYLGDKPLLVSEFFLPALLGQSGGN